MQSNLDIAVYSYKTLCFVDGCSEISNSYLFVLTENGDHEPVNNDCSASSWVNSVATCRGSDLAASGAGNGFVHLWAVETNAIRKLYELPLVNFLSLIMFVGVV